MITQNYIKMCEQAEEMQKEWKPKCGDCCIDKWNGETMLIISVKADAVSLKTKCLLYYEKYGDYWAFGTQVGYWNTIDKLFYLPIQEQLQEMIIDEDKHEEWFTVLENFCEKYKDFYINLDSMNELWLAFLYDEKYHKIWTGEKWVKAND